MWSLSGVDRYECAWAAGFFDGEGWAGAVAERGRATRQPHARVNQAGVAGVPEVLLRFQRALGGLGRIGGPDVVSGRRPLYRWVVSSRADVALLRDLLAPWLGQVKLGQLTEALGRPLVGGTTADADPTWWAWAAGLWDGEGCSALLRHRTHAGYLTPELSVTQSSLVGSPQILIRFMGIVGCGALSGPYRQRNATMDVYRWKAAARADAEAVLAGLWPHLGTVKRAQAQRLLDTLAAQPPLPRGNPQWGSHKTHCVHGHEYATARVRPYVSRGKGEPRRFDQLCLVCLREYARAQREKKRSAATDGHRPLADVALAYLLK